MSIYFSPGKLDLFFRVISKRSSGFYETASLSTAVDFGDFISIQHAERDGFSSNDPSLKCDYNNAMIRARELFRQHSGFDLPVFIHLKKVIPVNSGLGSSSGNAATTFWALNEFFHRPFSTNELKELAPQLGSEAPFFFSKGLAYCRGHGDLIEEVRLSLKDKFTLALPRNVSFSLTDLFQDLKLNRGSRIHPEDLLDSFIEGESIYTNDLESAALQLEPKMDLIKQNLTTLGFSHVMLTPCGVGFLCIGDVIDPSLSGVDFYPIHPITKMGEDQWFPLCQHTTARSLAAK